MTVGNIRLQPMVRARVASLGAEGQAWVDGLPGLLVDLCRRWSLRLGRGLPGGSASYLCAVVRSDGTEAVLKVSLPQQHPPGYAETLAAADGRGYVRVLEADPDRHALLLERLGASLAQSRLAIDDQLDALAGTLLAAWRPPDRSPSDKARSLADGLLGYSDQVPGAATDAVVERALSHADALGEPDPRDLVLVHGDPHPGNLLRVREARPGAASGWCFVDPEPFVADRAYDLGVAVRDFSGTLVAEPEKAAARLWSWCRRIAAPSGADPVRVWAWGFLERVSTGLYVTSFGAHRVGAPFLRSAALLAEQGCPGGADRFDRRASTPDLLGPPSVLPDVGTTQGRS